MHLLLERNFPFAFCKLIFAIKLPFAQIMETRTCAVKNGLKIQLSAMRLDASLNRKLINNQLNE